MSVDLSDLPVPPNCPYFDTCDEGEGEKESIHFTIEGGPVHIWTGGNTTVGERQIICECLCHCDEKMVPIICAIAQRAWISVLESIKFDIRAEENAFDNALKWKAAESRASK